MLCMRGHKDMGCFNPRSWLSTTVHRVPRYPKTLTLSTPPWMVQALCSIPHAQEGRVSAYRARGGLSPITPTRTRP